MLLKTAVIKKTVLLIIFTAAFYPALPALSDADLVIQGNTLYKSGRLNEAIVLYRKAIKANPSNFFAYMNCGYAYAANGDNRTALYYLEKAYKIRPEKELKKGIEMLKRLERKEYFKSDSLFKFSRKIGLNISSINSAGLPYDAKTGMSAGLEVMLGFGGLISGQIGVFFSQKGGTDPLFEDSWMNLDYIEFPVAVKLSFTPIKEILAGIYAGGSISLKTAAKYRSGDTEFERTGQFEPVDLALLAGLELTYPVLNIFFVTADFRYSLGLTDIYTNTLLDGTNSVFSTYLGFVF